MMNTGQGLCPSAKSEGTILCLSSLRSFVNLRALCGKGLIQRGGIQ